MANTYVYIGPGERWIEGDPTAVDYCNVSRVNSDHVHEAANTIMDTDAAGGILAPLIPSYPASPFAVEVDTGVTWSNAWWQAGDTRWWWLWNTADAAFSRADAEFYIPTGPMTEVPTS
jgi:hypothetical protein